MKKTNKKTPAKTASKPVAADATAKGGIGASVKVVPVSAGLYLASVQTGTPRANAAGLRLPALHVGTVPGTPSGRVEFVPSLPANGNWISAAGDMLVLRVQAPGAALVLTSMRADGGAELAVKFERLSAAARPSPAVAQAPETPAERRGPTDGLPLRVAAHIRGRGDMTFSDTVWAGKLGKGYWMESFSVTPLEGLTARDIEYKGLTASGFESPWITDSNACGTRGMAIPLVGFAIRAKGAASHGYDVEYSGQFQSGLVVGPLRNGTPCRSTAPNDPVEAIQVKIFKRGAKKSADKKRGKR